MTEAPKRTWRFGLLQLFGLQLAVAPLLLGVYAASAAEPFPSAAWSLLALYVFPPLYACTLATLVVPRGSASFSVGRRVAWGLLFGALYGVSLFLPVVVSEAAHLVRRYERLDRWDYRNTQILMAMFVSLAAVASALGGIAAGAWTAVGLSIQRAMRRK